MTWSYDTLDERARKILAEADIDASKAEVRAVARGLKVLLDDASRVLIEARDREYARGKAAILFERGQYEDRGNAIHVASEVMRAHFGLACSTPKAAGKRPAEEERGRAER